MFILYFCFLPEPGLRKTSSKILRRVDFLAPKITSNVHSGYFIASVGKDWRSSGVTAVANETNDAIFFIHHLSRWDQN